MSERNKEILTEVNAAFAEGNIEGFLSHCADDVEWTMLGHKTAKGKESIRAWMAEMGGGEPPQFTVENVIAEGDFVTAHGDMTMKEKDGKSVPYAYCDIYRFRDGKIVRLTSFVVKTEPKAEASSGGGGA